MTNFVHAQSDTLYYKYESILIGPKFTFNFDELSYVYNGKMDSVNLREFEQKFDLYSKRSIGLNLNTKYFSFYLNVKSFTSDPNFSNYLYSDLSKKSMGFSYFFNNFMVNINYYRIKGMNLVFSNGGQTESFPDFKFRDFNLGTEYFFNRKFSFSKINSYLYFPKKTVASFSVMMNYFSGIRTNPDRSFLYQDSLVHYVGSGYDFYRGVPQFNHITSLSYNGVELMPGIHFFLTRNQIERPRESHLAFYYKVSMNVGVCYYKGVSESIDKSFENQDVYFSVPFQLSVRAGFNTKHFHFSTWTTGDFRTFKMENVTEHNSFSIFGVSLSYRIPFRKGYQAVDDKMKQLFSRKKDN